MGLWAFSQALTDIFVDAAPANRIKGLAVQEWCSSLSHLACVAGIIGTSLPKNKNLRYRYDFEFELLLRGLGEATWR